MIIGFSLLQACASGSSVYDLPKPKSEWTKDPAILFIPGFYGTALKNSGGKIRFSKAIDAVGGSFSLAINQEELATPNSEILSPHGVFESVSIIPYVLEEKAYKTLIKTLKNIPRTQFFSFSYDWRDDFIPTIQKLDHFIDELHREGVPSITIVSHSMGGLLSSYYLRYGTQPPEHAIENWTGKKKVEKIIFMGTPFHGVLSPFRNMQEGTPFYWNKHLLSAEAVGSFPSSYYLLPAGKNIFLDEKQELSELNNFSDWQKNSWSLLRTQQKNRREREIFTQKWLARNKIFYERLHAPLIMPAVNQSLKSLVIIGKSHKTLEKIGRTKQNMLRFHENDLMSDGDGTVSISSANAPAWLKASKNFEEIHISEGHGNLWENELSKAKIMDFLTH